MFGFISSDWGYNFRVGLRAKFKAEYTVLLYFFFHVLSFWPFILGTKCICLVNYKKERETKKMLIS